MQNVGTTDKIIRIVVGLILVYLGYIISPWIYVLAIIVLLTAAMGYCCLYSLLGINTCPMKKQENQKTTKKKNKR